MASMGGGSLDPEPLIRQVRLGGYVNRLLQSICGVEGISKVGVKAELQNRIIQQINLHAKNNDRPRFQRLKDAIDSPHRIDSHNNIAASASSSPMPPPNPYLNPPQPPVAFAYNLANMAPGAASVFRPTGNPRVEFKPSPYYQIQDQIGNPSPCEVMTHHRNTVKINIRVQDNPILSRVGRGEDNLRVMVFCAGDVQGRQDIAFPHQSEIKVNGGEVKANLRGLKNKPGSTRPVDITKDLRLNINAYNNSVEMTYALTSKKFYLIVYVVKAVPVTDLVKKLENGRRITEKSVLEDMRNKARDTDIVTTASVLSLKCPLSTLRIDLPCRSISCRHNQCFDATSYLQLQEQGPTWLCPICNNSAPFDSLAVDEYVKDILKNTSRSTDQVIIQPDGKWELNDKKTENTKQPRRPNGVASDSDDDLVEITKEGGSVKISTPQLSKMANGVLSQVSRELSSARESVGSTSSKRPISAVIDLTSSGDEDDEPISRQAKRQFNANGYGAPPTSVPAYRPAPPPGATYPPPHI
ncbi:uncharacterized protein L3040_008575 [Drepanopeziza brunnea f. sp. 'multigermtubi']|uniref:uncharacterized protein n=1 Tax=Drepanopeziza brunnea f. sp. 'multigermtubi' TaxID=698441 RepID=UPI0023994995|nr:hypothetical protein L3040_008575 [Drepanopeziza brunnea f. sp. 'multigermtubi']